MAKRYSNNSQSGMEAGVGDYLIQKKFDDRQKLLLAQKLGNIGSPQTMTAGPNTQDFSQKAIEASILQSNLAKEDMPQMQLDAAASDELRFKERQDAYLRDQVNKAAMAKKANAIQNNQSTYRSITVDGKEIEFSGGFTDLHTESYKSILNINGFGIAETRNSIEIAHLIRNQKITSRPGDKHPFLK